MSEEPELARFRELLRIPTVTGAVETADQADPFGLLRAAIRRLYPRIEKVLRREVILGRTLLYRWTGRFSTAPTVLMAHQDVVAAPPENWTRAPFAAEITVGDGSGDSELRGRGAIAAKGTLVALLEAVESGLRDGVVPEQDVYLLFGHDGEAGGRGADAAAQLLRSRGVTPGFVLDTGGGIVDGVVPGVSVPLALIGIAGRGVAEVELSAPQRDGAGPGSPAAATDDRLVRAVARLGRHPMPARMTVPTAMTLEACAPHVDGIRSFAYRNARRLRPVLAMALARMGDDAADLVRTARVVTAPGASTPGSAPPAQTGATVTLGVHLGSSVDREVGRLRRSIADPGVEARVRRAAEPSPVSPAGGPAWSCLTAMLAEHRPDVVPTPVVTPAAGDSRFLAVDGPNVYRFSPFALTAEQRGAVRGVDERIGVTSWLAGVRMLRTLVSAI